MADLISELESTRIDECLSAIESNPDNCEEALVRLFTTTSLIDLSQSYNV